MSKYRVSIYEYDHEAGRETTVFCERKLADNALNCIEESLYTLFADADYSVLIDCTNDEFGIELCLGASIWAVVYEDRQTCRYLVICERINNE